MVANLAGAAPTPARLYLTATHSVYARIFPTKVGPRHEPYMSGKRGSGGATSAALQRELTSGDMQLDPRRCAMIIQDLQNDVIMDGGAFAESGAPAHAREQRVVDKSDGWLRSRGHAASSSSMSGLIAPLANRERPGVTLNAPLFEGPSEHKAMVRGSWGAAPVSGLEPRAGDFIVEKVRTSAWEGTRLETILKATGRDMIINTGAWTNMSVEHRPDRRRQGLLHDRTGGLLFDDERRLAQRLGQLRSSERLRRDQRRRRHQSAWMKDKDGAEVASSILFAARRIENSPQARASSSIISVKRGQTGTST